MNATVEENKFNLISLMNLLLVIALGISLAKLVWLVLTPSPQSFIPVQQGSVAAVSKKKVINYGKLIADHHIFGKIVVKKSPVVETAKPVDVIKQKPKVKLNAKLFGIIAYEAQNAGYALISNNGGTQKVYAVGDELQEGIVVSEILARKVIVDNNGVAEELLLPVKEITKKDERSAGLSSKSSGTQSSSNYSSSLPTGSGLSVKKFGVGAGPDLNKLREDIKLDPRKLTNIVRASPAMKDGQFLGFRIRSGSNRRVFNQLKFRNNDIITEINGILLDSPNKGMEVYSQFESATNLSIKLLRRNEEVFIEHSF